MAKRTNSNFAWKLNSGFDTQSVACSDESSAESEGYWSVDKELRRVIERTFKVTDERMEKEGQDSGSTAVVALVGRENIVIANCGDSKAILSRGCNVDPIVLTAEHRPHDHQVLAFKMKDQRQWM